MKKISLFTMCLVVLVAGIVSAGQITTVNRPSGDIPSFLGYVQDKIIVVMKDDLGRVTPRMASNGVVQLGIPEVDAVAEKLAVSNMYRQFPGSEKKTSSIDRKLARFYEVKFEAGTLDQAVEYYRNLPQVDHVERIGIHAMYATPNDGYYSYQWHLNASGDHDVDAPEAWNLETGSTSTIVALLDSGTRYYHPDLGGANASPTNPGASRGNMWINTAELNGTSGVDDDGNGYVDDWIGWDFINGVSNCWTGEDCTTQDNDPRDFNGHGTHTAGIIAMLTNDGYGMCGIAGGWGNGSQAVTGNGVKLMPLRMGYSYNYGGQEYGVVQMDAAASAFYYAANNGAKIASCSWGSSNSGGLGAAVDYFINNGGIVFVAAGNDGSQTADYLNGRGDCVSVAATDQNDNAASFTTYGTWVDISAPGVGIYSTYHDHTDPNTNYWAALDGTSMATPLAAGVGALIWSHNPSWTASQVKSQLYSSADNIDAYLSSTYIGKMGAGRVNAYAAVNTGTPAPVANFSGSPTSGTAPLAVNFTDLSTGSITSWSWNFGDGGSSTAQNPSHTYNSAGTYTVSLTVTGPGGSDGETKTGYISVSSCNAPVASFSGSPTSGTAPLSVNFTDQSSNSPTSWSWNFGDGGTSTAQNPSHTYSSSGTYTVTLTATNSCGSDQMVRTNYISVGTCSAPVANFSGSPTSGNYPLAVSFTDLSTNSPTSWSWTFGDGGTSTAQNPSHTYTSAGTYTVTLTAANSCGSDGFTRTNYITVTQPTAAYAVLPYSTGFESGAFDQYWFTQSSNSEGRILITTANGPHSGSYHMTMDDNTNGSLYAQNEAWLRLNLSGHSAVELSFWWKEFADEDHTQDGVFFSDNGGSTFTKVYSLTGGSSTYQNIVLDVDALASSAGLSLNSTFVIKFQQYDNYSISTDGMAFDDIDVYSTAAPPVADFSANPTSGTAPLSVQFTDASSGTPTSWSWNFGDGGTSTAQNPSHTYSNAGTYTVTLTATNAYGNDQEVKTDYITVNATGSWTVITYDDFESGMGNYTDGGADMMLYTGYTYAWQGYNAADIQDNSGVASSFYHSTGYNVSGYTEMEVDFYFVAISMETYEDFWVQYYDGSSWQTVASYARGVDFNNNTWYHATVTISSANYNFPTNARLRFMCDASGNADDVYIDQIEWRGMSGTASLAKTEPTLPDQFVLNQNYPNPFNPTTTVSFNLPKACDVTVTVYNIAGQEVATLVDGYLEAGEHAIEWDASSKASGVYLYRIHTDEFTATKKMVLLK